MAAFRLLGFLLSKNQRKQLKDLQREHRRITEIVDKLVHLGGSKKSLSRLDSPHDRSPIAPRSATLGSRGHLVDAPQHGRLEMGP